MRSLNKKIKTKKFINYYNKNIYKYKDLIFVEEETDVYKCFTDLHKAMNYIEETYKEEDDYYD